MSWLTDALKPERLPGESDSNYANRVKAWSQFQASIPTDPISQATVAREVAKAAVLETESKTVQFLSINGNPLGGTLTPVRDMPALWWSEAETRSMRTFGPESISPAVTTTEVRATLPPVQIRETLEWKAPVEPLRDTARRLFSVPGATGPVESDTTPPAFSVGLTPVLPTSATPIAAAAKQGGFGASLEVEKGTLLTPVNMAIAAAVLVVALLIFSRG